MKKKFLIISALSLLLAIPMFLNPFKASASSITDFGTADATATKEWGTYKKYQYSDSDGAQTLFYAEYKPSANSDYEFVVHDIRNDKGGVTLSTVANIAKDYENTTGRKVKLATNGDFFDSTGASIDSLVKDGEVIKVGNFTNKNAFGFDNDGNATVGRMTKTKDMVEVSLNGVSYRLNIDKLNQVPADGELALYTYAQNLTIDGCIKQKVKLENTTIATYRPLEGKCTALVSTEKGLTLTSEQVALVAKENTKMASFVKEALKYGATCRIIQSPDENFAGMNYVVGGWDVLVNDGVIVPSTHSTADDPNGGGANAPRTMIAMKADGTIFLSVLDGRQSGYAVGCTVAEEGRLAFALGAKYALELDGGGSSTFMFDLGSGLTTLNKPSDGSARRVSNAILLVEKDKTKGAYADLEDYTVGGNTPSGGTSDSGSLGGSDSVSDSVSDNTQPPVASVAGCMSSVSGISVILGGCAICALTLIKKEKENK